jgi:hypothetical protein
MGGALADRETTGGSLADRETTGGQPEDRQPTDREPIGEQPTDRGGGQPTETYYAGQLFLLHNDLREALQSFDECGDFLPALYGKMTAYRWLGDEDKLLQVAREIAALEGGGFLDGIEPLVIHEDMSFEEMADKIFSMLPYYELRDEIERTRALLGRTSARAHLEFHELVRL